MKKIIVFTVALMIESALCAIPPSQWLSLQGLLRNSAGMVSPDGDYQMCFELFRYETDEKGVWEECELVTVKDGMYQATLGDSVALPQPVEGLVEIRVGGRTLEGRIPLTGAPHAWVASWVRDSIADHVRMGKDVAVRSLNGLKNDVVVEGDSTLEVSVEEDTLRLSNRYPFDSVAQKQLQEAKALSDKAKSGMLLREGGIALRLKPIKNIMDLDPLDASSCIKENEGMIAYSSSGGEYAGHINFCVHKGDGSYGWAVIPWSSR